MFRLKEKEEKINFRNYDKLSHYEIRFLENRYPYIEDNYKLWNSVSDKYLIDRENYPLLMNLLVETDIINYIELDNLDFYKIKIEIKKYFSIDIELDGDYNEIRIRLKKLKYYNIVHNKDIKSENLLIINVPKNKISLVKKRKTVWEKI